MTSRPIVVPRLGITVTEVTLVSWVPEPGSRVSEGEVIAVVETDKVETELEAPATGTLTPAGEVGSVYPVGAVIGEIVEG